MAGAARGRGAMLLLLVAFVLAPLVLYGHFPVSPLPDSIVAKGAFDRGAGPAPIWCGRIWPRPRFLSPKGSPLFLPPFVLLA